MGAFDNVQFSKYRSTYVGQPIDQLINAAQQLNARYESAIEGRDKIEAMLANTPADVSKQGQLKDIANNINNDLRTFIQNGNWEDASLAIKQTAQKNIINNPIYKYINQDYQARQQMLSNLDEGVKKGVANGGFSKEYADSIAKYNLETSGTGPVVINADGSVSGVFKPITPPREVDVLSEPLKIAKEIIESTNISALQKYPGLEGYLYQDTYSGKDPAKILDAVKTWFSNNPDAKSYLAFKTQVDYHNSHYDPNTKTYIQPTPAELESLGFKVITSIYQGADADGNMIELQPGDITVNLPPVPVLDSNGKKTDKYVIPHSDAIATINDDLSSLWKAGYHNSLIQAPTSTIISMLSGQKIDRKIMKDEGYWINEEREYQAREKAKLVNDALGQTLPSNIPNSVPTSYSDLRDQKNIITNTLPTIMANELAKLPKGTLTTGEIRLLNSWLSDKNQSADNIMKAQNWSNPFVVADLIATREQAFQKLDYLNMLNTKAMEAAGIKNEDEINAITNRYITQARKELTQQMKPGSGGSISPEGVWIPYTESEVNASISDRSVLDYARRLAQKNDPKFNRYQNYMNIAHKQAGTINATNIFGMTKQELDMLNADLIPLVNNSIVKGGMAAVFDASTLVEVKDKVRGTFKSKIEPNSITIDKIKGFPGVSIIARPIIDDKGTLGDYVVISGIQGLDAILAKHPGTAKLMQYKEMLNVVNDMPGNMHTIGDSKFSIMKNLPFVNKITHETLDTPTGYTIYGPDANGLVKPLPTYYDMNELVKALDAIYK